MNISKALTAGLALSLTLSGAAFAQGDGDQQAQKRGQQQMQRSAGHGAKNDQRGSRQAPQASRRDEPGAGPEHQWHRGDRLPAEYRHNNYVVDDWRSHHLSAPPRGYHWVQSGNDYVLVAIATGVIAQLLLGNH